MQGVLAVVDRLSQTHTLKQMHRGVASFHQLPLLLATEEVRLHVAVDHLT